jgi:uncharacterized membrane protein YsdA (DUF1294 family)
MPMLTGFLFALSLVALVLCGLDKAGAMDRSGRVPERILLGVALLGGSPGLIAGMLLFRHKTRKTPFIAAVIAIVVLQLVLLRLLW